MWHQLKERPICRKYIIKSGLRPAVMYDTGERTHVRPLYAGERWNGRVCMSDDDDHPHSMSDGLCKQMRKMLAEGYWSSVDLRRNREVWEPRVAAEKEKARDYWKTRYGIAEEAQQRGVAEVERQQ